MNMMTDDLTKKGKLIYVDELIGMQVALAMLMCIRQ